MDKYDVLEVSARSTNLNQPFPLIVVSNEQLNGDDYMIASALRGPDYGENDNHDTAEEVKLLTTAVLRWFVGMNPKVGPYVVSPQLALRFWNDLSEDGRTRVRRFWSQHQSHFGYHILQALRRMEVRRPGANDYARAITKMMSLPTPTEGLVWNDPLDLLLNPSKLTTESTFSST